jgi:hypothetical protein
MCQDVEDWEVTTLRKDSKVRVIRDEIKRVKPLLAVHADDIRADRTAHVRRLKRLLPVLAEEFDAKRHPEEIRACLNAILERYDDAAVRSFIEPIVLRETRACLSEETCAVLA